jgi:hypothetical protein
MSSSKNISLLNAVNWVSGTSMAFVSFYLSIFQNCLGLYFRMFGNSNYILALCVLQLSLNFSYAFLVVACLFPCLCLLCLYSYFARLHDSSNQGARCFAHLFGLFYSRLRLLLITPAVFASAIRKSSTLLVQRALSSVYSYVILSNSVANLAVEVWFCQILAL